ncbi:MAG: TetR/AcrR family transcriptional regulator [Pseudomonadota bacterium]
MVIADRKTIILEAAQTLLLEVGNAGMTMRRVAAQAGISLGNLQYHYPTRDDLMLALLLKFLEPYEAKLDRPLSAAHQPLVEKLKALFMEALHYPEFDACASIFKELWAESVRSPDLKKVLNAYYARLAEFYRTAFASIVPPEIEASKIERAVMVLLPMLEGYCVTKDVFEISNERLSAEWAKAVAAMLEPDA